MRLSREGGGDVLARAIAAYLEPWVVRLDDPVVYADRRSACRLQRGSSQSVGGLEGARGGGIPEGELGRAPRLWVSGTHNSQGVIRVLKRHHGAQRHRETFRAGACVATSFGGVATLSECTGPRSTPATVMELLAWVGINHLSPPPWRGLWTPAGRWGAHPGSLATWGGTLSRAPRRPPTPCLRRNPSCARCFFYLKKYAETELTAGILRATRESPEFFFPAIHGIHPPLEGQAVIKWLNCYLMVVRGSQGPEGARHHRSLRGHMLSLKRACEAFDHTAS